MMNDDAPTVLPLAVIPSGLIDSLHIESYGGTLLGTDGDTGYNFIIDRRRPIFGGSHLLFFSSRRNKQIAKHMIIFLDNIASILPT
jgi:hypothetical protein